PDLPAILETDASVYAIAGILSQMVDGVKVPIAFYSKKHTPEESRYGTPDQELMAICYSLNHWRHYLEGAKHQVTIYTDHKNLETFNTTANLNRRQVGYWNQMNRFDYIIKHFPGKANPADLPSRREDYKPTSGDPLPEVHSFLQFAAMAQVPAELYNALVTATAADDYTSQVEPMDDTTGLQWRDDVLIYDDSRVYVPPSLRNRILELCHDLPLAGHQGQKRTYEKCSRDWYWPHMKDDVDRYVLGCRNCGRNKDPHHATYGKLSPLPVPEGRWTRVHMDFVTDLPTTQRGNNAILTIIDAFTKMAHFVPVKLKGNDAVNAKLAAEIFRHECIRLHGIPGTIVSDRDTRFLNKFWKGVTTQLGITQQPTTAYHSLANGQAERANTTIEALLRAYSNDEQSDWDTWLDTCEFAYNDSKTSATGMTPFYANYGFHPRRQSHPEVRHNTVHDVVNEGLDWAAKQQQIIEDCKAHLEKTRRTMGQYYDQHHLAIKFKVGDSVMLRTRDLPLEGDKSRKLSPRFAGPFPITNIEGPDTYRLDIPEEMGIHHAVYHVSKLEKYRDPDTAQGQQAGGPVLWRKKISEPIQNRITPYRILDCKLVQGGRQMKYKVEFTDNNEIVWISRRWLGLDHSDDELIDNFHVENPHAPRPAGYAPESVWVDVELPDHEDDTPRRGRPRVQFTRDSNYTIVDHKPYGTYGRQYKICNPERPTTTRWMSRTALIKQLGAKGVQLIADYTNALA
ncbi:MAG: RNase H-like domain-containing protein, partial [Janthinobacterium lividum]